MALEAFRTLQPPTPLKSHIGESPGGGWGSKGQAGPSSPPQGHTSRDPFSNRCYILENDTVQCDLDLYKSLQAWKDHKLHIDHEVTGVWAGSRSHHPGGWGVRGSHRTWENYCFFAGNLVTSGKAREPPLHPQIWAMARGHSCSRTQPPKFHGLLSPSD